MQRPSRAFKIMVLQTFILIQLKSLGLYDSPLWYMSCNASNAVSSSTPPNTDDDIKTENIKSVGDRLGSIHSKLEIKYGTMEEEVPEQKMVVRYLKGEEKVLEIGGNIGRNSLVIASILDDSSNLVTLESDVDISRRLSENMLLNNMEFHIESSALSKRKLIQAGWDTKPSETLEPGFKWVSTITSTS